MSNVFRAPAARAVGGRGILAHAGAFLVVLAFALVAFAHLSNATESEVVPAAAPTDEKTVEVAISNFTFTPNELTIAPGTTVKWVNHDDIPHTVVSDDKAFKSKVLDTDEQFTYTFSKPGTYGYFCSIHPKMTAKVVVQ